MALDPIKIDPHYHSVAFENDRIRAIRTVLEPHIKSPMHEHPAYVVVYLTDLHTTMKMADGRELDNPRKSREIGYRDRLAHQTENIGQKTAMEIGGTEMNALRIVMIATALTAPLTAQNLPAKWEELTAEDFVKALDLAKGTCLLPFGIIEKHGPTGPMGTDLLNVRYSTFEAVKKEYAIVFPEYYFGQIFEARHQPGTIAYSTHLQLELLQETTAEMARNGCKKVVIISGHGGNTALIQYFAQTTLETPKDYVVYSILNTPGPPLPGGQPSKPGADGHAGEAEIASVMAHRPDLVHKERAATESGADLNRLDVPASVYTGIWWYAKYPNHYQGDAAGATAERGKALTQQRANAIEAAIRAIKADQVAPRLQKEFFDAAGKPTQTKQ